jgi:FMN reductase
MDPHMPHDVSFRSGPARPATIVDSPHDVAHRQSVATALEALLLELGASVPAPTLAVLESALGDPDQLAADWAARHASALVTAVAATADTPIAM